MGEISTLGLDLAESVFQVHGADACCCPRKIGQDHSG
jgi:hypothetical protein